jgi:hypothetical protein
MMTPAEQGFWEGAQAVFLKTAGVPWSHLGVGAAALGAGGGLGYLMGRKHGQEAQPIKAQQAMDDEMAKQVGPRGPVAQPGYEIPPEVMFQLMAQNGGQAAYEIPNYAFYY